MGVAVIFVLCSLSVGIVRGEVTLEPDRPFVRVLLSHPANLSCCYKDGPVNATWAKYVRPTNSTVRVEHVNMTFHKGTVETNGPMARPPLCHHLIFESVQLNDSGLYMCWLKDSKIFTHGTYMQVHKPLEKTINLSESTKNSILTAEGVLLLLCVLVPSATLLFKSKRLNVLEKKKVKKEEENIYQGLNLDDCCAAYDQIERPQTHGHYQDVGNRMEDKEEIQLEKP